MEILSIIIIIVGIMLLLKLKQFVKRKFTPLTFNN